MHRPHAATSPTFDAVTGSATSTPEPTAEAMRQICGYRLGNQPYPPKLSTDPGKQVESAANAHTVIGMTHDESMSPAPVVCYVNAADLLDHLQIAELHAIADNDGTAAGLALAQLLLTDYCAQAFESH